MFLCKCTYKPEVMAGLFGIYIFEEGRVFSEGKVDMCPSSARPLRKEASSLELIFFFFFFSVNLHFPERALFRGQMCVWEYGRLVRCLKPLIP